MRFLLITLCLTGMMFSQSYDKVKITPSVSVVRTYHKSSEVFKIHRIQDTKHKLKGKYAITYRPHTSIQPIKIHPNIETVGEVELLTFIREKSNKDRGLIIDVREKKAYKYSIPSAINIPSKVRDNSEKMKKIVSTLGVKFTKDGSIDTKKSLDILIYSHGNWCNKAPLFIKALLRFGYPSEKIFYYRGGMQMWKILGFTTVKN